jgi:hypothetical protein
LMLATCAFIAGAMETVLRWQDFGLRQLRRHGLPRIARFHLRKHSSRRASMSRFGDCATGVR